MADHQVEVSPYQRIHRFADAFKGSQYAAPEADVEPHLHWRTWAVVLSCGFMLFADNYGILASKSLFPYLKIRLNLVSRRLLARRYCRRAGR